MTESSPQLLRHLVEQCLDRWEDGGESVVSVVCADHPELETRVRGRLATLVNMGLLGEPPSRDDVPERLGDFRLERVLGSGGMGVVYLAVQESLGREVALKVVRPDLLLFPGARERFQREVETISRLDHPGIVKVHAFGEEKGIPYFAMELVRGISLADLLGNLHKRGLGGLSSGDITAAVAEHTATKPQPSTTASEDWVRTVFRLVETVARALQHAHEQQILHRDIKPANIMLAADSRPLLLDFSLARTSEASDLTQSGALLGSLPYMAPEQVLGAHDRINATTDVYGLGVTLYELLTLHSPHLGSDVEETRARILEGTPLPVTRLNPRVPWDAETVCLKAIDVDQQQRYPSVAAFADDLRNFLEHKPIAARRPSTGLRIRRAAQRHPAKATALAIGLVVAIGGPILFGFVQQSYAKELGGALRETKAQKVRADGHLADALDAMSHVLGSTGDSRFMRLPFVDELSRKQLETAVAFYHRLEKSEPGDIRVARAMVRTLVRIGSLRAMIGEADAAERDLLAALA
ncbi:MAG: hypothetical protein CMJ85_10065, partial [Planctomycetes bacterium]|nr:hypothetical protein [Planctomycetota bacterium]